MTSSNNKSSEAAGKWKYLDDTLKSRLGKNSLTNILHFVITLPIIFVITPLILKFVGKEVYGIWVLTGTILVFLELAGGVQTSTALSIIVPGFDPKKEHAEINSLVNTLFVFYLFSALLFTGIYFLSENTVIRMFFKVDESLVPLAEFVLGVSFFMFLMNFVLLSYAYLLGALNIIYMINILHIIVAYVRAGLMIAALYMGYGIKGIVVVQMSTIIIETIIITGMAKRVFPPLVFNPFLFSLKKLKLMLGLSVKLIFTRASVLINQHADKLVLGYFLNPVVAAYYQIGAGISKYIANIPDLLGLPMIVPAASELTARGQGEKVHMLYDRVNKYAYFPAVLLAAGIAVFGREFIGLWLGEGYGAVYTVMIFLAAGYLFGIAGYPAMNILNGLGKVTGPMYITTGTAALNIALSIILVYNYGLTGALVGTVVSIAAGTAAMCILFSVTMKHSFGFAETILKPSVAAAAAVLINLAAERFVPAGSGWAVLAVKILVFSAVYFLVSVLILKHFDEKDMDLIKGMLPGAKNSEKAVLS